MRNFSELMKGGKKKVREEKDMEVDPPGIQETVSEVVRANWKINFKLLICLTDSAIGNKQQFVLLYFNKINEKLSFHSPLTNVCYTWSLLVYDLGYFSHVNIVG